MYYYGTIAVGFRPGRLNTRGRLGVRPKVKLKIKQVTSKDTSKNII